MRHIIAINFRAQKVGLCTAVAGVCDSRLGPAARCGPVRGVDELLYGMRTDPYSICIDHRA